MKVNTLINILLLLVFLSSCLGVNKKIVRANQFSNGLMNDYTNTDLNVAITYYGNANFSKRRSDLNLIVKNYKQHNVLFPQKNIVLWAKYTSTLNPMYIIGALENERDLSTFMSDTSDYGIPYYYKITTEENAEYSEVVIPLLHDEKLYIKEIAIKKSNKSMKDFKDATESLKNVYRTLLIGDLMRRKENSNDIFDISEENFIRTGFGNYRLAIDVLKDLLVNQPYNKYGIEVLKTYESFLGERVFYDGYKEYHAAEIDNNKISIDALISKIKGEKVVMFNENHISPSARLLVSMCLQGLYDQGFRVLALEALLEDEINVRRFPNIESGFYTREPNMANMIRTAKRIGYTVIGYEDSDDTDDRDLEQARQLIKKSGITNNNDKLIVLAGGGHIIEREEASKNKSMAEYFKEITHINPLTINQIKYFPSEADGEIYIVKDTLVGDYDLFIKNGLKTNAVYLGEHVNYSTITLPINEPVPAVGESLTLYIYDNREFILDQTTIPVFLQKYTGKTTIKMPAGEYIYFIRDAAGKNLDKKQFILK